MWFNLGLFERFVYVAPSEPKRSLVWLGFRCIYLGCFSLEKFSLTTNIYSSKSGKHLARITTPVVSERYPFCRVVSLNMSVVYLSSFYQRFQSSISTLTHTKVHDSCKIHFKVMLIHFIVSRVLLSSFYSKTITQYGLRPIQFNEIGISRVGK